MRNMKFFSLLGKYKKEAWFSLAIVCVFSFLVFVQTHLPFFKKFLPVGENKPVIVILNINLLLILLLLFLLVRIIIKSTMEKRMGIWGGGLKTKLILTMLSVSVVSSFGLFVLATWFYYGSMDRWFSQAIEEAVDNAMELSEFYYKDTFERYERIGRALGRQIEAKNLLGRDKQLSALITGEASTHFLDYVAVYDASGKAVATFSSLEEGINQKIAQQMGVLMREKKSIIPLRHGEAIVVATPLRNSAGDSMGMLFLADSISVKGTQGISQISATYKQFKKSRPLKKMVKYGFAIPLFLVTILSVFLAVWVGVKMANDATGKKIRFLRRIVSSGGSTRIAMAEIVSAPTSGLPTKIDRSPCDSSIDWRNESSARSPSTSASTSGASGYFSFLNT